MEWNRAAESLTGFRRDDVLGGPLPHLTPAQRDDLRSALATFEDWAEEVPLVFPRRHADGRTIEVCVTAYTRLTDADGRPAGFGSFFRAVRSTDPRTHARNVYSRALAQSARRDEVVAAVAMVLQDLLPGDAGYMLTRGPTGWDGSVAIGDHQEVAESIHMDSPSALDDVAETGIAQLLELPVNGVTTAALAIPAGPQPAGTVLALVGEGVRRRDDDSLELAGALASEAWAALRRVDALADLEGKVEILEAIAGVAQASGLDPDRIVNHIARHAANALSCERSAIYLWDDDRSELELAAFHSSDRTWEPGDVIHAEGRRAAEEMFASVEPFLTQDTRTCPWLAGPWDRETGAISVHGLPLLVGDLEVGYLVVAHTDANPRGFTSLCTQVGAALSRQAALAISNARLLASQAEANRLLHEGNRRRADYVEGITHDLRTPITAVLGFAKTLRRAGGRLSEQDREEALDTIERQALRVSRMLDDMMDSARADAGELQPDKQVAVPLHHVVSEALLIAAPEQRSRLSASCDPTVIAWGDADQLTRVVQNLIANALRYVPGSSPVEVVVERTEGMAQMLVVDHGPGMPAGVNVFGRFARGDVRGTGLGLYTVKTLVEAHGGSIVLRDTPGGGTTMDVRLPLFGDGS
ncbi:MAG: ATP-binding protein [Actinomycetota bacterium]